MFKHVSRRRLGACLLLSAQAAMAADYASETEYFQDFPVVLSASRLRQPQADAPNAMTIIDRGMIAASGFRTIPDLFKLVPGMYVSYYKASQPIVSYHGATDQNARRMQVMIDGRSVYLTPGSTVEWSNLPITVDDIERIEVIRGPAAASHGANSTQGVISIVTRLPGGSDSFGVATTQGGKGINDVSARANLHSASFDYRLTLARNSDRGYDDLDSPPNGMPLSRSRADSLLHNSHDSNVAWLLNFRGDYHPNGADRFEIHFGVNRDVQEVGFSDKNPTPNTPNASNANPYHDLIANSGFIQLGWVRQLADASELSLTYYRIRQDQHENLPIYYKGVLVTDPPIDQALQVSRDNIELQHTLPLGAANRLVYGAAYRIDRDNGQSSIPLQPGASYGSAFAIEEFRLFAHDEWRLAERWLLNTGAMLENDGMGHRNLSPRVALNLHLHPDHVLRGGVSVAYRTPSVTERYFPLLQPGTLYIPAPQASSPDLRPERLVSREIGYLGELRDWGSSLDLRLFSDYVDDGIYGGNDKTLVNGMSSHIKGVEATFKHAFGKQADLLFNYARLLGSSNAPALADAGVKSMTSADAEIGDRYRASIPQHSASVLYTQHLPYDLVANVGYYFQSALQPFDRGSIDYQPAQRRMDVRLAREFRLSGALRGEAALVVQNLLQQDYTEYVASNLFNRRGYATLSLNW